MNRLARFAGFPGFGKNKDNPADDTGERTDGELREVAVERMNPDELHEPIEAALRSVHDPEIPVNIYDLGLIYKVEIGDSGDVDIDMTLTAPACPVAGTMPRLVEDAVRQVEGVGKVHVELVWDPPWTQDRMTEEARLQLGMM